MWRCSMVYYSTLATNHYTDTDFIAQHTQGLEQALASSASEASIASVSERTGISVEKLALFLKNLHKQKK